MTTTLITGASAGIGAELAAECAKHGHSLLLVARRVDKLEALAQTLRAKTTVDVLAADLATPGGADDVYAFCQARGLVVDTLINNAGVGSNGKFWELDPAAEAAQIQLNVLALSRLCRLFVPAMVERRAGRILNIGSTAGFQPGPYMATYYATKAFVNSFTEALASELEGTGVTATVSCPGPVATEFADRAGISHNKLFATGTPATAADIAAEAYAAMMRGQPMIVHGAKFKSLIFGARFMPRAVVRSIAKGLNQRA